MTSTRRWWGGLRRADAAAGAPPGVPVVVVVAARDDAARRGGPALARALAPGGGLAGAVPAAVVVVDAAGDVTDAPAWSPGVAVVTADRGGPLAAWRAGLAAAPAATDAVVLVDGPVVAGRSTPFLEPLVAAVRAGARLAEPVPQPVPVQPVPGPWRPLAPAATVLAVRPDDAASLAAAADVPDLCRRLLCSPDREGVLVEAAYRTAPAAPGSALAPRRVPAAEPPWRWAIRTSVGFGPKRDLWGDLHFARGLAAALRARGQHVVVDYRDSVLRAGAAADDVALVVRGPHRIGPTPDGRVGLLWVISHPEDVDDDELRAPASVWAAGAAWATQAAARAGVPVGVLPQCTDVERFDPRRGRPGTGPDVLFVGSARDGVRPVVRDALDAGLTVTVHGQGWESIDHPNLRHAGTYLANEDLAAAYRSAGVVLNDHWAGMRAGGFWSNRLFDAAASGARVLTDRIAPDADLDPVFHGLVRSYGSPAELAALAAAAPDAWPDDDERARRADLVRAEHGFGARADVLLDRVRGLLGR